MEAEEVTALMIQLVKSAYKKMNQPHVSYVTVRPYLTILPPGPDLYGSK
jgi:hypothetical protein